MHFRDEEEILRKNNFPEYHQHKKNHEKLISLVSTYKEQFEQGDEDIERRVLDFLKLWLNGHIMGMDRQYKPFITESSLPKRIRPEQRNSVQVARLNQTSRTGRNH